MAPQAKVTRGEQLAREEQNVLQTHSTHLVVHAEPAVQQGWAHVGYSSQAL